MPITALRRVPIRWRLALWYTLFLVTTLAAVDVFLLAGLEDNLAREVDEALRLRALHIESRLGVGDDGRLDPGDVAAGLLELTPLEEFSAPGLYVQVRDDQGAVLGSSPNLPAGQLPLAPDVLAQALAGRAAYADVSTGAERLRLLAWPVLQGERVVGVVLVGESRHLVDVTLRATRRLLLLAAAGAALASLVGGWWLTGRALGPVAEVTRVARRIAATGQFEQRLAVPPARDELGELTATFNEMLARLEKTFDHQREFLADVSHELRGPLMVIRGNLDLLKLDLPDGERQESAREATEELERMTRLVADLLFLAEVDAQEMVHHEPVALHEVVSEVWTRARELDAGAHELVVDRNDPLTVRGDRHWLGQVLWNLVENALRYTPAGGRVTLALSRHGPVAELMVADTGPGIAAEHLPRLFERFYRVDRTRSRQQGGTGLGLAIVQQVVQAHGGQVRVRSQPGEGSTFTIALPVESP